MDDRNPAEELPELYRAVLDAVSRLERAGERSAAFELRHRALRVYSRRWDERSRRALEKVLHDAAQRLAASPRAVMLGLVTAS
jgi:hypothetical protein